MDMDNREWAVCGRVGETNSGPARGSDTDTCVVCGKPVWVSVNTRKWMAKQPDPAVICVPCAKPHMRGNADRIVDPPPEVIHEVAEHLGLPENEVGPKLREIIKREFGKD